MRGGLRSSLVSFVMAIGSIMIFRTAIAVAPMALAAPVVPLVEPAGVVVEVSYGHHFEYDLAIEEFRVPESTCDSVYHDDFLEVASLADSAGFPGVELHTAVAVAFAESLGDAGAVSRNRNGSRDTGLWQINSVHGYSNLKDPVVNAQAAFEVWSSQGWVAWYAHTPRGGRYGSGENFILWSDRSRCTIDFYLDGMVQYSSSYERDDDGNYHGDYALSALR